MAKYGFTEIIGCLEPIFFNSNHNAQKFRSGHLLIRQQIKSGTSYKYFYGISRLVANTEYYLPYSSLF